MKKVKKEYAPIANKMEYKFPDLEVDFITFRPYNTDDQVKLMYCRKCRHIHVIKKSENRHSYGNSSFGANNGFKCPKCGHMKSNGVCGHWRNDKCDCDYYYRRNAK